MSETLQFNLDREVATLVNAEKNTSDGPKIQKVPAFLRERTDFCQYYSPKLISIGPIHHGDDNVKAGVQYKHIWAAMWIREKYFPEQQQQGTGELTKSNKSTSTSGQHRSFDELIKGKYAEFKNDIVEMIKQCYSEEVIEEYKNNNYEALAWMLFVDGCSLLEFMKEADISNPGVLKIKIDQLILTQQDLLLLENQIPFKLLKILCPGQEDQLLKSMHKFVILHHMVPDRAIISQPGATSRQPTHLLDYLRYKIVGDDQTAIDVLLPNDKSNECNPLKWLASKKKKNKWPRHRNIQELKAAGIRVKRLEEADKCNIHKIRFSSYCFFFGRLLLPEVIVDDSTATTYLNLIAYEMCPDFKNDFNISSYVAFLDSLIDHPDDVKLLRSAGILHNNLGSDEEVANLFNTITTDMVPDPKRYDKVRKMVREHCRYKYKTWMAEFYYTHFESPWSFLALLAAILVLGLTFAQTYFAIPNK